MERQVKVGYGVGNRFNPAHSLPLGYSIKDKTATYKDYINGITGKSDPIVRFSNTLMIHLSTLRFRGYKVQDIETKEMLGSSL